ncbi:MAG: methyltransferase domain-containing protein [Acidobacteria bacterium]|nr:methyltransferase domain-containing protein [Acidobacteriota bacterium]
MSDYLLGMAPAEIERLRRQHEAWRDETTRVWRAAGFGPGQTVVDLGCGPGFTSLDLASLVGPAGRIVAVDASSVATACVRDAVARERRTNVDVVTHDVCDLDLSAWRADGVFARWLFSFLPNPDAVVARLARGLPPGAVVAVMDYWHYLAIESVPAAAVFRTVFRAVHESFARAGGSLDVAGVLPAAFEAAGVRVTSIEPIVRTGRPGDPVWRWIEAFLALHLPSLVDSGMLADREAREFWEWWREIARRPGAFVFGPPMLAVVGRKTGDGLWP